MANQKYLGWKAQLQELVNLHNHLRIDGRPASFKTQNERAKYLFKFFNDLREMGFMAEPCNIKQKHIEAICNKYEADGIAASTIQTYLSFLRAFCQWIKKPGMIRDVSANFSSKDILFRQYAAVKNKSWDKPEIDKYAILEKVRQSSEYVYTQLLLEDAFGLRRKESIMFRPHIADKGDFIFVSEGSKGKRAREIPIENDYQREVLLIAKYLAKSKYAHVADPTLSLKQNLKKFSNVMAKHGITKAGKDSLEITAHGLRSGYAMREMDNRGVTPSVKGEEVKQHSSEHEKEVRREVSELLGHSRPQIIAAYAGAFTKKGKLNVEKQLQIQQKRLKRKK